MSIAISRERNLTISMNVIYTRWLVHSGTCSQLSETTHAGMRRVVETKTSATRHFCTALQTLEGMIFWMIPVPWSSLMILQTHLCSTLGSSSMLFSLVSWKLRTSAASSSTVSGGACETWGRLLFTCFFTVSVEGNGYGHDNKTWSEWIVVSQFSGAKPENKHIRQREHFRYWDSNLWLGLIRIAYWQYAGNILFSSQLAFFFRPIANWISVPIIWRFHQSRGSESS